MLSLITISMPDGTFWEKASFFILAAATLIGIGKTVLWAWPYFRRPSQFKLEIASKLSDVAYESNLSVNERYNGSQLLSVPSDCSITFLLRLKSKQKQIHFRLHYTDQKGNDFPDSIIALERATGFEMYPQYWGIDGRTDHEGGVQGNISYPSNRRKTEKDCYIRVTAKVRQSCCGILKFEGFYNLKDDRRLSAKCQARLNIQIIPSVFHKEGSQKQ